MRKNLEYLYAVARQMMGALGVWQYATSNPELLNGGAFRRMFQADVERELQKWGHDKLGMLAALGRGGGEAEINRAGAKKYGGRLNPRTSLTDVGLGKAITEHMSGRMLLLQLASLTVVAAMLDVACNHHAGDPVDPIKAFEEMPDRAMHF